MYIFDGFDIVYEVACVYIVIYVGFSHECWGFGAYVKLVYVYCIYNWVLSTLYYVD